MFAAVVHEAALDAGCQVTEVERRTQGRDHPVLLGVPETRYLTCLIRGRRSEQPMRRGAYRPAVDVACLCVNRMTWMPVGGTYRGGRWAPGSSKIPDSGDSCPSSVTYATFRRTER